MSQARTIGELVAPLLAEAARLRAFQDCLNDLPSEAARKASIITAHCEGLLDHEQTTLLIQAYGLECA